MAKRIAAMAAAALLAMAFTLVGCAESDEMKQAKADFTTVSETVTAQLDNLNDVISETETLVYGEDKPLDESLTETTETAISNAKAAIVEVPEMPGKLEEITAKTEELNALQIQSAIDELTQAKTNLSNSIEQRRLVTAPTEAFVIERLGNVDGALIDGIAAVTEDNDPNGQLNKAGGYTSTVYFSSPLVDPSKVSGDTIIAKGTDGGGAIEVYANEDDANKRNDYLAVFDGGILSNGSHSVVGTVVVRTSDKMTASQQKEMEAAIIAALTALQ